MTAFAAPADAPHALHTRERAARAVDAWTPQPAARAPLIRNEPTEGVPA